MGKTLKGELPLLTKLVLPATEVLSLGRAVNLLMQCHSAMPSCICSMVIALGLGLPSCVLGPINCDDLGEGP